MKKIKKILLNILIFSFIISSLPSEVLAKDYLFGKKTYVETIEQEKSIGLKDDFYSFVNRDWLKNTEIPASQSQVSVFYELDNSVTTILNNDFDTMLKNGAEDESKEIQQFINLYGQGLDFEKRNEVGMKPIANLIEKIENIKTIEDLNKASVELAKNGIPLPFSIGVSPDMQDSTKYALYFSIPGTILPEKNYYDTETGNELLNIFSNMQIDLLTMIGKNQSEAEIIAKQGLELDKMIAPFSKTALESSDYTNLYNPINSKEFIAFSKNFDFNNLISSFTNNKIPENIIVPIPEYIEKIDTIINENNLELIKSWMIIGATNSFSNLLTEEYREKSATYYNAISGITESTSKEYAAYIVSKQYFPEVIGKYFGEKYFGEKAKAEVTTMVNEIIATYENRLRNNSWLSETTKLEAIKKLDKMIINVGYPDKLSDINYAIKVKTYDEGGSFLNNILDINNLYVEYSFSMLNKSVDKNQWPLSADTVNAMYSATSNSINFPAAILQAPFYSLKQTDSQNYGGIGAVIAHEISHAFDNNGASFDGDGNLKNWWTEEDFAEFKKQTDKMIKQFDGIDFADGKVNGTMTVSENIADLGGLTCALEIVSSLENPNYKEFFTNWAVAWRNKSTPEVENLLLNLDVHAPSKLRANIQIQNFEEFFKAFDIKEGDEMWRELKDRVSIW